jgi:CarD family transcriptional regulator
MYEVGSRVMYASNGVCDITDIREESFSGEKRLYYVLTPLGSTSSVFVPTDNEQLLARMRPLLSADEIHDILSTAPKEKPIWIADNHERNNHFQQVLLGSDTQELFDLTRSIYLHKQELAARGKKNLISDETALKKAERILFGEIAAVFRLSLDEVQPFIRERQEHLEKA